MLQNIIKSLFKSQKALVGVSITPEGGVEAIIFDTKSRQVKSYASRKVSFNPIKKIVDDMDELSKALEEIIAELGIVPGTPVVVTLPSFHFGFIDTAAIYSQTEEGIYNSIVSEVEQSYMFKQNLPIVSYANMNSNYTGKPRLAYCAVQKDLVGEIRDIFLGANLVPIAIENSYSSMLKSIEYFELAQEEIHSNAGWGLISINQNSYSIFSFVGNNLTDIYEDPIAIKTFEKDEVNYAVASVINSNLQYYNFNSVLVVNNSADITARDLANQLNVSGKIKYVENNGKRTETFFNATSGVGVELVTQISLFALGAAIYNAKEDYILKFNLNDSDGEDEDQSDFKLLGVPIELTSENYIKLIALAAILTLIVVGPIYLLVTQTDAYLNGETAKLKNEIAGFEAKIAASQIVEDSEVKFNPIDEIMKIKKNNEYNLACYDTLSSNIPHNVWLTYFYGNQDAATIIRGKALSSEDVYRFYRNVKSSVKDSEALSLSKINFEEGAIGRDVYEFEITNNTYQSLLDSLKSGNSDYQAQQQGAKTALDASYKNSYWPISPVSDGSIISPLIQDELNRMNNSNTSSAEILDKLHDFNPSNMPMPAPNMLPPT